VADPMKLDRELRSGMVAAEQIAEAIAADRANVAQLSRITRAWAADAARSTHA
jgi:flavin-dependent dehydrogenase